MPTFFARRYMRKLEHVGITEKVLSVFLLLVLAGIVGAFVWQSATNQDYLFATGEPTPQPGEAPRETAVGENPLPDPGSARWRRPKQVFLFTPDTLYQKINGRADLYLQFHVVGLTFGTYTHQAERDRTVDVYWYDMGKPENALGIYRSEAPEHPAKILFGKEGYETGGAIFFIQGSHYVQVLPAGPDETDKAVALAIATHIHELVESGQAIP